MSELKTSAIRHPENNSLVIRREWQVKATRQGREKDKGERREDVPECSAELLSILEYHYNNPMANKLMNKFMQAALSRVQNNRKYLRDTNGWLPYSVSYLEEVLLEGRGRVVIERSLVLLQDKGFISSEVPQDIPAFYGSGTTKWYRLEIDTINLWIERNYYSKEKPRYEQPLPTTEPYVEPKPSVQNQNEKIIQALCNFHRHIHNKKANFIYDKERIKGLKDRIKEGRTLQQCCQAIIGNVLSDYHQGRHSENLGKVFDDIELIFRNAKKIEAHIQYASDAGVTETIALEELKTYLSGQISRYSKLYVKPAQNGSNQSKTAYPTIEIPSEYREFAMQVVSFFVVSEPLPNKDILATIRNDAQLQPILHHLVDSQILSNALLESASSFREGFLPQRNVDTIKAFSDVFARIQMLNRRNNSYE